MALRRPSPKIRELTDPELKKAIDETRRRSYAKGEKSQPTGTYWQCPGSFAFHPAYVFVELSRGKSGWYFLFCGCGARCFMPRKWEEDMGLTYEQAQDKVMQFPGSMIFN